MGGGRGIHFGREGNDLQKEQKEQQEREREKERKREREKEREETHQATLNKKYQE